MTRMAAAAAQAGRVVVDVTSDSVCPWCYVGKRRLEQAIKQVPGLDVEVRWHPYQLNPNASEYGEDKLAMYKAKFGSARVEQMLPYMTRVYADLGLKYSIGGLTGNTFNSHRLIAWAGKQAGAQQQNALVEHLFNGYFCQEQFINDREVLLGAVEKVGLDVQGATDVLDGKRPDIDQEVRAELAAARREGISGVPFFVINDKYHVSGAQQPEEFVSIFNEILSTQRPAAVAAAGVEEATACTRDGACL